MNEKNLKLCGIFGILSALLYIAAYAVGAALRPGFSSVTQAVSVS